MNKDLLDYVRSLSARDKKTLTQRVLKLAEEQGELAKVALPFEGAPTTLHRIATKQRVAEEAVDVILCALSVLHKLDYADDDVETLMRLKSEKWDMLLQREEDLKDPEKIPHEIHVTVKIDPTKAEWFKQACIAEGVKPIVLDLPLADGSTMQDVMTSSHFFGTTAHAIEAAHHLAERLEMWQYKVVRIKIETVPWHPHAPQTMYDSITEGCYFEAHVGVIMHSASIPSHKQILEGLAALHTAKMSRNAFKKYDDGQYIQMVTLRTYGSRNDFDLRLNAMLEAFDDGGYEYEKVIREYSIYDTNVTHDAKWIGNDHV